MKRRILLGSALLLITLTGIDAAAQETKTKPLHSFLSSKGYRLYKFGAGIPPGLSDGPWKNEGVVAHVMPNQLAGTKPIYELMKADNFAVRFAYTPDPGAAQGGWQLRGVAYHVAMKQAPGTVPLYQLHAPPRQTNPGEQFSGLIIGTDNYFYTIKSSEKTHATNNGWIYQGVVGYVWKEPFPRPAPDLTIQKTIADDSSVRVIYANKGRESVNSASLKVALFVYDRSGKQLFSTSKAAGGVSGESEREVVIPSGNVSLRNHRYQVKIDPDDVVQELNESNNQSGMLDGPMGLKIASDSNNQGKLRPPSIALAAARDVPPKFGLPHTAYRVTVSNWNQYPGEYFQSTKGKLPPNPCGDTRMQARVTVFKDGKFYKGACKALHTPQDLKTLEVVSTTLADADQLEVMLTDRLTEEMYRSERYSVGWHGLGDLLQTVGCEKFLNRAGHYLCTTDQGMTACEKLQKNGKPIKCTRAGKSAK